MRALALPWISTCVTRRSSSAELQGSMKYHIGLVIASHPSYDTCVGNFKPVIRSLSVSSTYNSLPPSKMHKQATKPVVVTSLFT